MVQTQTAYRWTTSDLDRLPDDPFLQYEIIDGELFVSRRPHLYHSRVMVTLVSILHPLVRELGGIVLAEPGIVWGTQLENNVIPDTAVVLPDRLHLATGPALSGLSVLLSAVKAMLSRSYRRLKLKPELASAPASSR